MASGTYSRLSMHHLSGTRTEVNMRNDCWCYWGFGGTTRCLPSNFWSALGRLVSVMERHISHRPSSSMTTSKSWDVSIVKPRIGKSVGVDELQWIRHRSQTFWTPNKSGRKCYLAMRSFPKFSVHTASSR